MYQKALSLKKSIEDKAGIALLNNNLGTLYANMGAYKEALQYFEKSLALFTKINIPTDIVMVNYNIGELYFNTDKTKTAIKYFSKSLKMAKQNGQIEYISDNYEALMHCYAKSGNYNEFQNYYRLLSIRTDSLIQKLHEIEMLEIETKYNVKEELEENITLQKENEIQRLDIKKYKLLFAGAVSIVIIVFLGFLLFIKVFKK